MHPMGLGTHAFMSKERETYTTSPRALHSGLLRGLYMFSLPRVHAADVRDPQAILDSLPKNVGKPEFPDTGWDRIKDLFNRGDGQVYAEEVKNIAKGAVLAAVVGLFYGGLPAGRQARQRYIQLSQAEIYHSRVQAVRSAHNAAIRGFLRYGCRWSWRVTAFVTIFNTVNTAISVYRDRDSMSHFVVAGAVTGGVFRMYLGLRAFVGGSAIGAALGIPFGALGAGLQKLGGETLREKRRRERRELFELRVAEWHSRLQLTDKIASEFSCPDVEDDVERITELLSQPRNSEADLEP